jgi:mgtE-like transporter
MHDVFDRDFRDIVASELLSVLGGLATGTVMAAQESLLLAVPGLLIIFPGFLEMRGNVSGSMAARITAGLFLGELTPGEWRHRIVRGNLIGSFLLAFVVSLSLGVTAFAFTAIAFGQFVPELLVIPLVAGVLANAIEVPLTLAVTFALFRRGHDPSNVVGPFVTSTGDVTSILALLLAVIVV